MIRLTHAQLQPIGLDIGRDSIHMIQLEVAGGCLSVRAACERKLPEPPADAAQDDWPAKAEIIRQMLREGGFSGRRIVTSLPRQILHIKNHRLPNMPLRELESAVRLEAGQLFGFEADAACIHCLPAGEVRQGGETRLEVIVAAARNEDIEEHVERLHACGVAIDSLDIEPCALFRAFERFLRRREDEQEVQVLADMGFSGTRVVIGKGREISFIKSIDIGGRHLREQVAARLGISPAEAQALRKRLAESGGTGVPPVERGTGVPPVVNPDHGRDAHATDSALTPQHPESPDPVRRAVFDASRAVMEQLGHELALCLRYQAVTFRGCRPTRLRLLGGEAADPGLHAVLSAMLTIPVEVGRPLYSVDIRRLRHEQRRGSLSEWALALGLGLRRTQQHFGPRDGRPRDAEVASCQLPVASGQLPTDSLATGNLPLATPEEAVHARA